MWWLACMFVLAAGQGLRRKPHVLRATSLAEVTVDSHGVTTARLIPITVLDGGSFHDAGIYKNEPQPMVLDQGVVYEVQKTGQAVGYVTVGRASKNKDNWTALAKWQPLSPPSKPASASPTPASSVDDRPILHRAGSNSPAPTPSATPASAPTPEESSSDRPVLRRSSTEASPTPTPSTSAGAPAPTPQAEPESEPVDPDRPTLRRRAPRSSGSTEESSQPSATTNPPSKAANSSQPVKATEQAPVLAARSGAQWLVAVSDEQSSDARSYKFPWKPGEEGAIDSKLRKLAAAQLAGPVPETALTNVVIRSFDLDLSNDAVMVISAEVPPSAAPAATGRRSKSTTTATKNPPATPGATRYITLIVRVDFDGNPQKLAFSVTDSSRLDVAPRLELIDAVDVDGDGFGELLFRQYSFDDESYVIYQIGRSTVTKLFEGASQPLK